jgi:transposase, IS30 family
LKEHWFIRIGSNHDGAVAVHVDKASKYLVAGLAKNKTMEQINQVTIGLFENIKFIPVDDVALHI